MIKNQKFTGFLVLNFWILYLEIFVVYFFIFLAFKNTDFAYNLLAIIASQYLVLETGANSHLDIRVGVGRDACVVRDGVGG